MYCIHRLAPFFVPLAMECIAMPAQAQPRDFAGDVAFLERHTRVVVLGAKGAAQVVVAPKWQGRVMTSTAGGPRGTSYGWINDDLIKSGKTGPHINVWGGEDRFWMGPEGGQFAIFFKPSDPFDLEHWQTPAVIDTDEYEIVSQSEQEASFRRATQLSNASATRFDVLIERVVRLLGPEQAARALGVKPADGVRVVAFESENKITNAGKEPWSKSGGLLSIWILGMFKPSPETTVVIPFQDGNTTERGEIVNDAYFGKVPAARLSVAGGAVYFKGDGQLRSKIGIGPRRAKAALGSYDAAGRVLTIVQYTLPASANDYVNSMWEQQTAPFSGDVVNSYNDGPPKPGAKPLGPFYELETSSPAAALRPGESLSHVHRTFHFEGDDAGLNAIAKAVLGVELKQISSALK